MSHNPRECWCGIDHRLSAMRRASEPRTMRQKVEGSITAAYGALGHYIDGGWGNPADELTSIGDLIADLLHLAAAKGVTEAEPVDIGALVATAVQHYEYEADPDHADELT